MKLSSNKSVHQRSLAVIFQIHPSSISAGMELDIYKFSLAGIFIPNISQISFPFQHRCLSVPSLLKTHTHPRFIPDYILVPLKVTPPFNPRNFPGYMISHISRCSFPDSAQFHSRFIDVISCSSFISNTFQLIIISSTTSLFHHRNLTVSIFHELPFQNHPSSILDLSRFHFSYIPDLFQFQTRFHYMINLRNEK